jgi:hypothetical protein
MATAYCIDISGSVMDSQIKAAFDFVRKGFEPGDFVIVFDVRAVAVTLDWPESKRQFFGRGGSDTTEALALAKELGAYQTVCISDGYLSPGQLDGFSKDIDIIELEASNGKRIVSCKRF